MTMLFRHLVSPPTGIPCTHRASSLAAKCRAPAGASRRRAQARRLYVAPRRAPTRGGGYASSEA